MKYKVLFSLKNNENIFKTANCSGVIAAFKVKSGPYMSVYKNPTKIPANNFPHKTIHL